MTEEAAPPVRAFRLTLRLDADDLHELACALYAIAHHAERGELTTGVSGGYGSGYIYELLSDPAMTHDAYFQELDVYLDRAGSADAQEKT